MTSNYFGDGVHEPGPVVTDQRQDHHGHPAIVRAVGSRYEMADNVATVGSVDSFEHQID
jgi:hypothetical protein